MRTRVKLIAGAVTVTGASVLLVGTLNTPPDPPSVGAPVVVTPGESPTAHAERAGVHTVPPTVADDDWDDDDWDDDDRDDADDDGDDRDDRSGSPGDRDDGSGPDDGEDGDDDGDDGGDGDDTDGPNDGADGD